MDKWQVSHNCLHAALPESPVSLRKAEEPDEDISNGMLTQREQAFRAQICYVLAVSTQNHAFDRGQEATRLA